MPEHDDILFVVSQWMEKAENDLIVAVHTLKLGSACPSEIVCFHSQQCIEKYLKALLVYENIDFPKTHSLKTLMDKIPLNVRPELSLDEQEILTNYAVFTRYPGNYSSVSLTKARLAVRIARRVRKQVREQMPGLNLRRKS
jgi:HEPN domain-containing protein